MKRLATRIGEHSPVGGFVSNRNRIGKGHMVFPEDRLLCINQMDNIPLHLYKTTG